MGALILLFVGALGLLIYIYNDLQRRGQAVREAHSNVLVLMKKRVDLANKLMDIARSFGEHEKLIHMSVSQNDADAVARASTQVSGVMSTIAGMASRFPELKANQTYQILMSQLQQLETQLQHRREVYNGIVRDYNTRISQIPFNLIAPSLGFTQAPYFGVDGDEDIDLRDFRTDDGEMLKALVSRAGDKVVSGSKAAMEMGRELAERGKDAYDQHRATKVQVPGLADLPEAPVVEPEGAPDARA